MKIIKDKQLLKIFQGIGQNGLRKSEVLFYYYSFFQVIFLGSNNKKLSKDKDFINN